MTEKKLAGKVAIVTGGARGIGRGYALRLAGLGADVAVLDRNLKSFEVYKFHREQMTAPSVLEEIENCGVKSLGIEVDLLDRGATDRAVDRVAEELGGLDIVACNAGGGVVKFADQVAAGDNAATREGEDGPIDVITTGTPSDCDDETIRHVMDVNVLTCMYTCMAAARHMKKQKSGKIVTVASMAGVDAQRTYHPYGTAKAAIIYYTRSLAHELGPYNINVNCLSPGKIHSGRNAPRPELLKDIPLGRFGTVEDCAKVMEFLTTDLSDWVTGKVIHVDGGSTDQR